MVVRYKDKSPVFRDEKCVGKCETYIDSILCSSRRSLFIHDTGMSFCSYHLQLPVPISEDEAKYLKAIYVAQGWEEVEVLQVPGKPMRYQTITLKV